MGRRAKYAAGWSLPPLRDSWRERNRLEREARALKRAKRKALDKTRPTCRCSAYPWPHRPGGGFCCYPDPPLEHWQPKPSGRPYQSRYAGLRRQIARANGLHPIKDRARIVTLVSRALSLAKQTKRQCPRMRYREVEITTGGVRVYLPISGPEWGMG